MPSSDYYRRVYGAMAEGNYQQRYVAAQKGNGFFGRIIRGSLIPVIKSVLPYLKNVALDGVGGLVDDLKSGKTIKEAAGEQWKRTSDTVLNDVAKKLKTKPLQQQGTGLRRKKKRLQGRGVRKPKVSKRPRPQTGLFKV